MRWHPKADRLVTGGAFWSGNGREVDGLGTILGNGHIQGCITCGREVTVSRLADGDRSPCLHPWGRACRWLHPQQDRSITCGVSQGAAGGGIASILLQGEQSDIEGEGGRAANHRDGAATGDDGLGTPKVRSSALEGVPTGQVGRDFPTCGPNIPPSA